jgi:enhanced entry protein EnhC
MFFGFGKLESIESSIILYEKSAELGNPKAMMALGRIYEKGIGTKEDMVKATFYYDAAAAKNEPYALYWLGKQCEVIFF